MVAKVKELLFVSTLFGFFSPGSLMPPDTLRLVHILYRHGDRTPKRFYPTDPHQHDLLQGFEELTTIGMNQQFELGKYFRQRYDGFISDTYKKSEIRVRSTDRDRTLMSAYCNLAGLYPPEGGQMWNKAIPWQPIPVHTVLFERDPLLSEDAPCEKYEKDYEEALASDDAQKLLEDNKDFITMLAEKSGFQDVSLETIWNLCDPLLYERAHNFTQPSWITDEVYQKVVDFYPTRYHFWFYTPEMIRLKSGTFIQEIVKHTKEKVSNKMDEEMKMFLYSAHDSTIVAALIGLGIWNNKQPNFLASLIFELHEMKPDDYHIKILYKNESLEDINSEPIILTLKGCNATCPVDTLYKVAEPVAYEGSVEDWIKDCDGISTCNIHSANVAIVMFVILLLVVLATTLTWCWYHRRRTIPYQPANFSAAP